MIYGMIKYLLFLAFFILSFYALSSVQFDKFCNVREPMKVRVLFFLLCFVMAYLAMQATLELTIMNGLGV